MGHANRKPSIPTRLLLASVFCAAFAVPGGAARAGKGASYGSLTWAIRSGNSDSIVAEIERAEKLPCASCIELVRPLIDDQESRVRDVAAWWLAKRAVRGQVRDEMFDRLARGDTIAARNAAEVLGRFMHPDALHPLEQAIHAERLGVAARAAAAAAMGTIGSLQAKPMLEGALASEVPGVRAAAAHALRQLRGTTDAVAVVDLLFDSDPEVVHQAALTAGALREVAAIGPLESVVLDLDLPEVVRKHAAWALGAVGDPSSRAALESARDDDPSMLVRGAARAALARVR